MASGETVEPRGHAVDVPRRRLGGRRTEGWSDLLFVPVVLLAIGAYLSLANGDFLTQTNLTNVLIQASILGVVAFGATFVILCGELDLSVGTGVALVSVVTAIVMRDSGSLAVGMLAGLMTGVGIGVINGLIVTRLEVPSFIATLGMLVVAHGVALALTNGAVVTGVATGFGSLANDVFLGLRGVIWWMLLVFAVLYALQSRTVFGVRVYAVGGNREAARLSAIAVKRIRFLCFVISGATIGIGGLLLAARVQSGQPNAGSLLALTSIAAIVVGGTSLAGGRGSVVRTLWGVLLISVVENGLDLQGASPDLKQVVIGVVFIAAASADFFRRSLRRSREAKRVKGVRRSMKPTGAPAGGRPPT